MKYVSLNLDGNDGCTFEYIASGVPEFGDSVIQYETEVEVTGPVVVHSIKGVMASQYYQNNLSRSASYIRMTFDGEVYNYRFFNNRVSGSTDIGNARFEITTGADRAAADTSCFIVLESENYVQSTSEDSAPALSIKLFAPMRCELGFKIELAQGRLSNIGGVSASVHTQVSVGYEILD